VKVSNPSMGTGLGFVVLLIVLAAISAVGVRVAWHKVPLPLHPVPTSGGIGNALLGTYVLPFEAISMLLLAALVGAVTLAGGMGRKKSSPRAPSPEPRTPPDEARP